jgi:hypothetical protein
MVHRRSKWPTRSIEIDPVEMQSVSFSSSETLPCDGSFVSGPYCGLALIFFTIDWTSEAAVAEKETIRPPLSSAHRESPK